jgi:hypothetical protein
MARAGDPTARGTDQDEHPQEVVVTNDKKQPGLPVVEVDQAFPLMTTDGVSRPSTSGTTGDQGPTVTAAIRDVLGWRPRVQDPKAFTAALSASFELSIVEDHVVAKYVQRGVAAQADLGGVTGGQASLYLRAKAAHEQITRMLDSLKPLRTDADPEDCEAYRGLVRDSVRRIVAELGREGGPRVPLVDSAFATLTGFEPTNPTLPSPPLPAPGVLGAFVPQPPAPNTVPLAPAEIDPDRVPGQLGALRDRFGLDDDHVNTVDEEKQRTSFWTLVELITDLQRSWDTRRLGFTLGAGNGFLGTDLVQISRLLAAAAEQVDEMESVFDSVLVSSAERQTVNLDRNTGLSLDDLVQWMRVFFSEDGPNIIRDAGRDGLVSSFTPTAVALLLTLRDRLVRRVVPCCGPACANGCVCGSKDKITCIPLGCCTPLPPGMYSGRVKIAVSTLCGLVERLTSRVLRIGRFAGAVLLDLTVTPFDTPTGDANAAESFVRVEVRGLHLRPTYIPAFYIGSNPQLLSSLALPLQGSASADQDSMSGIFERATLPTALAALLTSAPDGVLVPASEVPLVIVDGELGRVAQGPAVTTWPKLRPASAPDPDGLPDLWVDVDPNQRFVPQSPPEPAVAGPTDEECLVDCTDDCVGCDCGCHDDTQADFMAKLDSVRAGQTPVTALTARDINRLRALHTEADRRAEAVKIDAERQRTRARVAETRADDTAKAAESARAERDDLAAKLDAFGKRPTAEDAKVKAPVPEKARAEVAETQARTEKAELAAAQQDDLTRTLREAYAERRKVDKDMDVEAFARTKVAKEIVAEALRERKGR